MNFPPMATLKMQGLRLVVLLSLARLLSIVEVELLLGRSRLSPKGALKGRNIPR